MIEEHLRISICIVCMNRLHHLKQTLAQNIADNKDYPNLEFVILDYNSKDGLSEWLITEFNDLIEVGVIRYYRTSEPQTWNPSHSKNLAFKLATGEILCNMWADYFTGPCFASYTNSLFKDKVSIVLTPIDFYKTKKGFRPPGDVLGKVCVKKNHFLQVGGFDERINKHGFEDYDFVNRLEMAGLKRVILDDPKFLKYIPHSDHERYMLPTKSINNVLVSYINPWESSIIILYKNGVFKEGTLIENSLFMANLYKYAYEERVFHFKNSLKEIDWAVGNWTSTADRIALCYNDGSKRYLQQMEGQRTAYYRSTDTQTQIYQELRNKKALLMLWDFLHFYDTRNIMEKNLKGRKMKVNETGFGKGTIYMDFGYKCISI
ncbi:glycosyltransferase family 2 protein [Mucilaginibacter daejeonensis]|nr:glycosyltransferase family A protein [Mucilaginibacter daejeonensis]UEG51467.1 glycosyltransferase family 2 protein [Mucilaginibacter daejeonensis]